jgi:hypothetical protein
MNVQEYVVLLHGFLYCSSYPEYVEYDIKREILPPSLA